MKILIATGGTGGHIYPAISLAKYIVQQNKRNTVLFMGSNERIEGDIVKANAFTFEGFDIKTTNGHVINKAKGYYSLFKAYQEAKIRLNQIKPDVVVGFGSYISVPIVKAAQSLGIPTMIHEQNSYAGSANKWVAKKANVVVTSYTRTAYDFPSKEVHYLGNPRASEVSEMVSTKVSIQSDLHEDEQKVLIVMGSLGSQTVNRKIIDMIPMLEKKNYQTIFVTGKMHYEKVISKIREKMDSPLSQVLVVPYIEDMLNMFNQVDLIVSRAGATTIAEIQAMGLPAIYIPSPYVVKNHQELNAKAVVDAGGAKMILENDLTSESLLQMMDLTLANESSLKKMKENALNFSNKDASKNIYQLLLKLSKETKNG